MTTSQLSALHVMGAVTIAPATPGDLPAILDLVNAVHLPPEGIAAAMDYFWAAREAGDLVGTIGFEVYDDLALLRSLAVTSARQHTGLGSALTTTALSYLTTRQFRAVYLLTTTAESFFARYDFHPVARTAVPASVQHSVEFQSLCPATATCMARTFLYAPVTPVVEPHIRAARFADLPMIQDIHNQGITDRVATLDTTPRSLADTQLWFFRHGPRHPVLVAEVGSSIAGWASLNTFNPRPAYQYVADLSVYLARSWRSKGLGSRLLQALIPLARELGYHKLVLSAFPTNTAGMRLYERQGFTTVGIYKEMGLVDGHWVDTIIMEKLL
jgi:L-amino acid N-acyltransferase YncA